MVLMTSGSALAVPLFVGLYGLARLLPEPTRQQSAWFAGLVALATGGLDIAALRGRLRPWSVGTQVPSLWGHTHGPWKAAMRYGLRLGVGPATVLTSWTWWGALAIAALASNVRRSILIAVVFVGVRMTLTVAVGFGVTDGIGMSRRMRPIMLAEKRMTKALAVLTCLIGMAVIGVTVIAQFGSTS